ncbi:DUF202 domain-containing protein [Phycicoccus ginsengisoli]
MLDPRFSLANERTFLAWTRTSFAFMAAGVGLEAMSPIAPPMRLVVAVLLTVLGVLAAIQAWQGWVRTEKALGTDAPLPAASWKLPIATGLALACVVLTVGMVM